MATPTVLGLDPPVSINYQGNSFTDMPKGQSYLGAPSTETPFSCDFRMGQADSENNMAVNNALPKMLIFSYRKKKHF